MRRLIHDLLAEVGKEHPQALIYPLTVASKSQSFNRQTAASSVMDKLRAHSAVLVDQVLIYIYLIFYQLHIIYSYNGTF